MKRNVRSLIFNALKTILLWVIANAVGYLFYALLFNKANVYEPETAALRTSIYSLACFALFIFLLVKFIPARTSDETRVSEIAELVQLQVDSGYRLDFKAHFINAVKTRLWSVYVASAVVHIPLAVNCMIVKSFPGMYLYTAPIPIYKFSMTGLFAWEVLGSAWGLGFILFVLVFSVAFTVSLWLELKEKLPPRPSWMDREES